MAARRDRTLTALTWTAATALAVAATGLPSSDIRAAAAVLLLWFLPGWTWGRALGGQWLIGSGLGMAVNVLLTLALYYLPGPLPHWLATSLYFLTATLPSLIYNPLRRKAKPNPPPHVPQAQPSCPTGTRHLYYALFALALALRLINLGYSEFQGDEGIIMVRAASAIEGDDETLFYHQKGPVEVLIPLATWQLCSEINELWARLPFAWIGVLGVMALARLGSRWFGQAGGLIAGALLAINGFHIAFSRIVQYQGWVVLMSLLSLVVLEKYRRHGRLRELLLGAVFWACGALGHYDAVLFLPAIAMLALRWTPGRRPVISRPLIIAAVMGTAILASFYLPFIHHPNFAKTLQYLAGGRVRGTLHFNATQVWTMSTFYNSSYYVLIVALTTILGIRFYKPMSIYAWVTWGVPFTFYFFAVFDPRTHIYTFYPGASLLAGMAVSAMWPHVRQRWRWALTTTGGLLYALCAVYAWIMFVNHTPEYQRTYPEHKLPIYWTTYAEPPLFGRFGFPHRAGWHAIGALFAQGTLHGTYASNEEQEITNWYTRQAQRTHCPRPDIYIIAERVQDEVAIDWQELQRDYQLAGVVTVGGEPRIRWYTRDVRRPLVVDDADYRQWWRPTEVVPPKTGGAHPVDFVLGKRVRLVGYDLEDEKAIPGGWVRVTLYWRALRPLRRNYQVFTHLYDGHLWAQHDGAPECAMYPTKRWEPNEVIPDPHLIILPTDMPTGPMPLLVGMYDLETLERLPVPGTEHNAIHLTDVIIREESQEQ